MNNPHKKLNETFARWLMRLIRRYFFLLNIRSCQKLHFLQYAIGMGELRNEAHSLNRFTEKAINRVHVRAVARQVCIMQISIYIV